MFKSTAHALRFASVAVFAAAALTTSAANAKGLKIGFSQVTLQSPFYVQLKEGAQAAAKANGDELIFLDANGDVNKQNNDIQDLLTRKVNVLIVNPVNPDAVAPSLDAASRAHVPVITVDRAAHGSVAAYIGRDNVKMGELSGKALVAALKKKGVTSGKIVEIQGDAGGTVMQDRRKGFHNAFNGTGFKVVEGPYSEYIRANAVTAMQDLLQANGKDVLVAGIDGLSEALNAIESGNQYVATALNDPRYLGDITIQTAEQVAAGKKVPSFVDAGTEVVTKDNVKQIKHDGLFGEYRPKVY